MARLEERAGDFVGQFARVHAPIMRDFAMRARSRVGETRIQAGRRSGVTRERS